MNLRWITILTIVILLYFKLGRFISTLNENKYFAKQQGKLVNDRYLSNGFNVSRDYFIIMAFVIIILAITIFMSEKASETQGFIASMPFTRKEIIFNKWIIGVISILISF